MKSIAIHDLDDSLDTLIREKAKEEGLSLSRTEEFQWRKDTVGTIESPAVREGRTLYARGIRQ